jgi:hypothetical protein
MGGKTMKRIESAVSEVFSCVAAWQRAEGRISETELRKQLETDLSGLPGRVAAATGDEVGSWLTGGTRALAAVLTFCPEAMSGWHAVVREFDEIAQMGEGFVGVELAVERLIWEQYALYVWFGEETLFPIIELAYRLFEEKTGGTPANI